jgi:hypothetical protein
LLAEIFETCVRSLFDNSSQSEFEFKKT